MKTVALVLAILFFAIGILYWTGTLQVGAGHPGPHHSHAILFFVLALVALAWMRFAGKKLA